METAGAKSTKRQDVRKKRKIIIFAFEICLILVMLGVLWLVMQTPSEGPSRVVIDPGNVAISENIQKEKEEGESPMLGYMNVALFGVDAKTDSQLYKSSRSDVYLCEVYLDDRGASRRRTGREDGRHRCKSGPESVRNLR